MTDAPDEALVEHRLVEHCVKLEGLRWPGNEDVQAAVSNLQRRFAALATLPADAPADVVADFIEEWLDCGNMGWCHNEGRCTRHNPDEYRAALQALRTQSAVSDAGEPENWRDALAHMAESYEAALADVAKVRRCECSQAYGLHHNPACQLFGIVSDDNIIPALRTQSAVSDGDPAELVDEIAAALRRSSFESGGGFITAPLSDGQRYSIMPLSYEEAQHDQRSQLRTTLTAKDAENARLRERVKALEGGLQEAADFIGRTSNYVDAQPIINRAHTLLGTGED